MPFENMSRVWVENLCGFEISTRKHWNPNYKVISMVKMNDNERDKNELTEFYDVLRSIMNKL